jgi:C-22 sterol desaturase
MDTNATSFTSPLATVRYGAVNLPSQLDYVVDAVSNAGCWQIVLTVLALLVAYDQCMLCLVLLGLPSHWREEEVG